MKSQSQHSIPAKANRILNAILVILFLIVIRLWHLGVVQHDEKLEASKKPQKRVVLEKADRALISDRFGTPLALNKIQYNIAVSYGGIREVPRTIWQKDEKGKKCKVPKRKEYITDLSKMLSEELGLNAERIEDLIHAKASLFGNVPFLIKENVPESTYFRLKVREKDWPGLIAEKGSVRSYPKGPIGAEVVGYLGAISKEEYEAITLELQELRSTVNAFEEGEEKELPKGYASLDQVTARLNVLERKAYTINDQIGKAGVEKSYDERLRGAAGMHAYVSDPQGHCLEELQGYPPLEGSHIKLAISVELQEYAERLLTEYEQAPLPNHPAFLKLWSNFPEKQPWIKGGAIVVMEPNTGEILALASYPRFNPNDFVKSGQKERVHQWLESEEYLADLWDRKEELKREKFDSKIGEFFEESIPLTWKNYLRMILPAHAPVLEVIEKKGTLEDAISLQKKINHLLALFPGHSPVKVINICFPESTVPQTLSLDERESLQKKAEENREKIVEIKNDLNPFFSRLTQNSDKLLLIDLYRLVAPHELFSNELLNLVGGQTLKDYRECSVRLAQVRNVLQSQMKKIFHEIHFKKWREEKFKDYLALKREEEEKAKKKWGKPYIEYLDEAEKILFANFWEKNEWNFLLWLLEPSTIPQKEEIKPYLAQLKEVDASHLKEATCDLSSQVIISYLKTHRRYNDLNRPLFGLYPGLRNEKGITLEKHLASAFYPKQGFGYARSYAFRQSSSIGSVFKIVPAYEAMRQRYLVMQKKGNSIGDINPLTIIDDKHKKGNEWIVGYTMDKKPIPRYYRGGLLPRTDHVGVGEVDVVDALAVSSNPYFALLSGDIMEDPEDLCRAAKLFSYGEKTQIDLPGEIKGNIPADVTYNRTGLYSFSIGQHSLVGTPLQTAVMLSTLANGGKVLKPKIILEERGEKIESEVRREIFLPKTIRKTLLKGMTQVIKGEKGTARILQKQFPKDLVDRVVGKTSTAEAVEKVSLDAATGRVKFKHVGFNLICFKEPEAFDQPELVVVVYLRFGEFGWGAAPLAMKMVQKWEEITQRGN